MNINNNFNIDKQALVHRTQKYIQALRSYPKAFTEGKVYMVLGENEHMYWVRDDFGRTNAWGKQFFKVVK